MPVPRITFVPFDCSKKSEWLMADINGLIDIWGAMISVGALIAIIFYCVTDINIFAPFIQLIELAKGYWGLQWALVITIAITLIPPFILVFVFRYNFSVIGKMREFRYICRWL
jgi:hypothetical protein